MKKVLNDDALYERWLTQREATKPHLPGTEPEGMIPPDFAPTDAAPADAAPTDAAPTDFAPASTK
jgi:hypothetical protein